MIYTLYWYSQVHRQNYDKWSKNKELKKTMYKTQGFNIKYINEQTNLSEIVKFKHVMDVPRLSNIIIYLYLFYFVE